MQSFLGIKLNGQKNSRCAVCKVEIEVKGSVLDTMEHVDKQYTESMRKLLANVD